MKAFPVSAEQLKQIKAAKEAPTLAAGPGNPFHGSFGAQGSRDPETRGEHGLP